MTGGSSGTPHSFKIGKVEKGGGEKKISAIKSGLKRGSLVASDSIVEVTT